MTAMTPEEFDVLVMELTEPPFSLDPDDAAHMVRINIMNSEREEARQEELSAAKLEMLRDLKMKKVRKDAREVADRMHAQKAGRLLFAKEEARTKGRTPISEVFAGRHDYAHLKTLDWPTQEFAVDRLMLGGSLNLFAGASNAGKSARVAELISLFLRAPDDPGKWLNQFTVKPIEGNVALMNLEMDQGHIVAYMDNIGMLDTPRLLIPPLNITSFNIMDDDYFDEAHAYFREHDIEVAVWDSLTQLNRKAGLDEDKEGDLPLERIKELRDGTDLDLSVVLAHHGKADTFPTVKTGKDPTVRGASGIQQTADTTMHLIEDKATKDRFFMAEGRMGVHVPWGLTAWVQKPDGDEHPYDPNLGLKYRDAERANEREAQKAASEEEMREEILAVVGATPGLTAGKIAQKVSGTDGKIQRLRKELLGTGELVKRTEKRGRSRAHCHYLPEHAPEGEE